MKDDAIRKADREILADLYLARQGYEFLEELIEKFGSRFGGTPEEHGAARFIAERFRSFGLDPVELEPFSCQGWTRKETKLEVISPVSREIPAIALPFCPPGEVEGELVYLGDGHPQMYEQNRDRIKGNIVMVTTATPRFYHRSMHRGEKLGRALELGAIGFIWMRGEPGGLPETGSGRFNQAVEVPAISVSYEHGHEMLRLAKRGPLRIKITSTNEVHPVESYNVVGELKGSRDDEIIIVGAHYDGHDISQSAADDGAGTAVLVEAARALSPHRHLLGRTVRFVAFAQEEMGLIGSEHHASRVDPKKVAFMLNLDGAGRGQNAVFTLQGWPEGIQAFKDYFKDMTEDDVAVGDSIGLYSDMYPFAIRGVPSAWLVSQAPQSPGAPRGYGHTFWDSLDKISARAIQADAARVARLLLRLSREEELPVRWKEPRKIKEILGEMGLLEVLRYELRPFPEALLMES